MKVVAVTICHYGSIYLTQAIGAIKDVVDEHLIFYTENASHGSQTELTCPDTKQDIERSIRNANTPKARLVESSGFRYEGQQRDFAYNYARVQGKADVVLVVDYDEIWPVQTLISALDHVKENPQEKSWLINFSHLFRNFNWICKDGMWPVRIINFNSPGDKIGYIPVELGDIYHFGYVIPDDWMDYKFSCHGHVAELRKGWYENVWKKFPESVAGVNARFNGIMKDVHPTCDDTWNPKSFDRYSLPPIMHSHGYFDMPEGQCVE